MKYEVWFVKRDKRYKNVEILDKREFRDWLDKAIRDRLESRIFGFLVAGIDKEILMDFENYYFNRLKQNKNRRK